MSHDLKVSCRCGTITGHAKGISPAKGTLCVCYCKDCRAFARHIGALDLHDSNGGIEIFQFLPGRLEFATGIEHLKALRISKTGLLRWYASCCGTPMGNMLATPKIRFMGLAVGAFSDRAARKSLGPLLMSHCPDEAPHGTTPIAAFGYKVARRRAMLRHMASAIGLSPKGSPFFKDENPIAPVHILTEEERKAAYTET